ncbi:hypothetical protein ACFE04_008549 [Oxalis oulophora]
MGIMQLLVLLLLQVCLMIVTAFSLQGSVAALAEPPLVHHMKSGQPPSTLSNPGRKSHAEKPAEISSSDRSSTEAFRPRHAHKIPKGSSIAVSPAISSSNGDHARSPASSYVHKFSKHHHRHHSRFAPQPSYQVPASHNSMPQGPSASPYHAPFSSPVSSGSPAPSEKYPWGHSNTMVPVFPPSISPLSPSLPTKKQAPPLAPVMTLPPPPPNDDCASILTCSEPLTSTPPGSACGCVWPIQVKLQLDVAIYTFFPLVSELADEIAAGIGLNHSQVRITGADAASLEQEKTTVLIDLVPHGGKFSDVIAFSIYKSFWQRRVHIKPSLFGDYEVSYVQYPGLPPSPPSSTVGSTIDDGPYPGQSNNGMPMKPLGVDIPRQKINGSSKSTIIIIVLSIIAALVLFIGITWLLLLKRRARIRKDGSVESVLPPLSSSPTKPSEYGRSTTAYKSVSDYPTLSISSGTTPYTGSAKAFTLNDIERATNNFHESRIVGEGGFGVVYGGFLDDGSEVAVKVLKRDDKHGGREFMAEIEMLSRLHHRNLIKLIGVCSEDHARCLVYVLVPNGSVESHLHGLDKDTDPLDCYLAPEYAMTGHLLVKSDVYSYGVVLLELLTGRKPVDLSMSPGQENLVAYARPLLTSREGLETIIDPDIMSDATFDSIVKVAAIASMCVQPEVSHRPFMGEVVQALKLVCNEFDEILEAEPIGQSHEDSSTNMDIDNKARSPSGEILELSQTSNPFSVYNLSREPNERLPASILGSSSVRCDETKSSSFRRYSSSGPLLRTERGRKFWQKLRSLSRGSMSEHGYSTNIWSGS